jgi:hypothetical protein
MKRGREIEKARERCCAPAAASPQRFGSFVVLGRYPGSRALTHRLPALSRSGVSDASTLADRCGGSTGIAHIEVRSPVSRLTVTTEGRHGTADKRRPVYRALQDPVLASGASNTLLPQVVAGIEARI